MPTNRDGDSPRPKNIFINGKPYTKSGAYGLAGYGRSPGSGNEGAGILNSGPLRVPTPRPIGKLDDDKLDHLITRAVQAANPATALTNPKPGRGLGGGSSFAGGLGITPAAVPQANPMEEIYNNLIAQIKGIGADQLAGFDPLRQQMQGEYAQASKQLYEPYQNSRENLDQYAQNLGVSGNDVYKGYDDSLRQIQENSDQSQAMDMAWLDKMKQLKSQSLDSLYMGLSNEKAQQMALWQAQLAERAMANSGGGGGGGRRSGGGGGGSGKSSSTASEVETMNPSYSQEVMDMVANDPYLSSIYQSTQNDKSIDKVGAALQGKYDNLASSPLKIMSPSAPRIVPKRPTLSQMFQSDKHPDKASNSIFANKQRSTQLKGIQYLINLQNKYVGGTYNPTTKNSITTKGNAR